MKYPSHFFPHECSDDILLRWINNRSLGRESVTITIPPRIYEFCHQASLNQWANTKKSTQWGRGLVNNTMDPSKSSRIGYLGEVAVARLLGLKVDFSYHHGGQESDHVIGNNKIEVKTAAKYYSFACGLIKVLDETGMPISLKSDIYLFCYLDSRGADLTKKTAHVSIVGWCLKNEILRCPNVPARREGARHKNKEIPYQDLHGIRHFYNAHLKTTDGSNLISTALDIERKFLHAQSIQPRSLFGA